MADVEPYVDMPYSEVANLKKQIKKLQEKDTVDSDQLMKSMASLTKGMDSMLQLFRTAADEMKIEEEEEKALGKQVQPLMDKLDEIIEQNKIIAEGMIAVSDLIKEKFSERNREQEQPKFPKVQQNIPPPPNIPPLGQPPGMFSDEPPFMDMPPPTQQARQNYPQPNMRTAPNSMPNFNMPPPSMDMPPPPPPQKKGVFKRS